MNRIKNQAEHNYKVESSVFLATTALEEFWDTTKPIVFLGEWCRRYSRRRFWEPLGGEVIQSYLKDKDRLHIAYLMINDIYERLLPLLTDALNSIHGKQYSNRYWRIVIGPWLFHYIDIIYDRYMSLKIALDRYPDFTTIGLLDECFITPRDTNEFVNLAMGDQYNLQLYTKILNWLRKDFTKKIMTIDRFTEQRQSISTLGGQLKLLIKSLSNFAFKLCTKQNSVILVNSYFSHVVELKFVFKTAAKIIPYRVDKIVLPLFKINNEVRSQLKKIRLKENEFEALLITLLPYDIPLNFIECFEMINKYIQKHYPSVPSAINTNEWYFNEAFKYWAAYAAETGTKLLGLQHGGNYGSVVDMQTMDHEVSIADRFYSWGWELNDNNQKIVPMPANLSTGKTIIGANNKKEGILYATTGMSRYLYRLDVLNNYDFCEYLKRKWSFLSSITQDMRSKIRLRPFVEDYGWDIIEQYKDNYPDVPIEGWDIPFLDSLKDCRLFVCDHLSTVHALALSLDKPTILFWDTGTHRLRPEAIPYYEELHSVGILYKTPDSAAAAIAAIYNDVVTWWNEPHRQSARLEFCDHFARNSPNAIDEWTNEFKKISGKI